MEGWEGVQRARLVGTGEGGAVLCAVTGGGGSRADGRVVIFSMWLPAPWQLPRFPPVGSEEGRGGVCDAQCHFCSSSSG